MPVFSAGGEKPSGWRDEVFVEDLGRGWHLLRAPKRAYIEWDDGEQELYDMSIDPYPLQSLHADPGKADLISGLSARLTAGFSEHELHCMMHVCDLQRYAVVLDLGLIGCLVQYRGCRCPLLIITEPR